MLIGKIVKSNAHHDYVCQVYQAGEVATPPARDDYQFSTYVSIRLDHGRCLVGLIYDTVLVNPEFGRLGPRLSPAGELAVFSPDYLQEKAILVGIVVIGLMATGRAAMQGVPLPAASSDAAVESLSEPELAAFHRQQGVFHLAYLPHLLTLPSPLAVPLARNVVNRLQVLFPQEADRLAVVRQQLSWHSQITPLGGSSS
jgi:hypothetical protein